MVQKQLGFVLRIKYHDNYKEAVLLCCDLFGGGDRDPSSWESRGYYYGYEFGEIYIRDKEDLVLFKLSWNKEIKHIYNS